MVKTSFFSSGLDRSCAWRFDLSVLLPHSSVFYKGRVKLMNTSKWLNGTRLMLDILFCVLSARVHIPFLRAFSSCVEDFKLQLFKILCGLETVRPAFEFFPPKACLYPAEVLHSYTLFTVGIFCQGSRKKHLKSFCSAVKSE